IGVGQFVRVTHTVYDDQVVKGIPGAVFTQYREKRSKSGSRAQHPEVASRLEALQRKKSIADAFEVHGRARAHADQLRRKLAIWNGNREKFQLAGLAWRGDRIGTPDDPFAGRILRVIGIGALDAKAGELSGDKLERRTPRHGERKQVRRPRPDREQRF